MIEETELLHFQLEGGETESWMAMRLPWKKVKFQVFAHASWLFLRGTEGQEWSLNLSSVRAVVNCLTNDCPFDIWSK